MHTYHNHKVKTTLFCICMCCLINSHQVLHICVLTKQNDVVKTTTRRHNILKCIAFALSYSISFQLYPILNLIKVKSPRLLPMFYRLFTSRGVGDLKMFLYGSHQGATWMYYELTYQRLLYKMQQRSQVYMCLDTR